MYQEMIKTLFTEAHFFSQFIFFSLKITGAIKSTYSQLDCSAD